VNGRPLSHHYHVRVNWEGERESAPKIPVKLKTWFPIFERQAEKVRHFGYEA
jgi:hypothetical protein